MESEVGDDAKECRTLLNEVRGENRKTNSITNTAKSECVVEKEA